MQTHYRGAGCKSSMFFINLALTLTPALRTIKLTLIQNLKKFRASALSGYLTVANRAAKLVFLLRIGVISISGIGRGGEMFF